MLAQEVLQDMVLLAMHAQPPTALFSRRALGKQSPAILQHAPAAAVGSKQKTGRQLQVTEASLGISAVSIVYQTTVTVPAEDRPEAGALTLACTERFSVQGITAEVYPLDMQASVQIEGLAVSHQEAPETIGGNSTGNAAGQTVQIVSAAQWTLQAGKTADMQAAQRTPRGSYVFIQGAKSTSSAASSTSACASPPAITTAVHLQGTHAVFHADAVLAMCKAAGDVSHILQQAKATHEQPGMASDGTSSVSPTPAFGHEAQFNMQPDTRPSPKTKTAKPKTMPRIKVNLQVSELQVDFIVAEHITWGLNLPNVSCHIDSKTVVALLQKQQLRPKQSPATQFYPAIQTGPETQMGQLPEPNQASGYSTEEPDKASGPTMSEGGLLDLRPNKASGQSAERPRLQLKDAAVTLNSKLLLLCGVLDASLDFFPTSATLPNASTALKQPKSGVTFCPYHGHPGGKRSG